MKKIFTIMAIAALASIALNQKLSAVPANPKPVTVTQPDGTTLTIRVHGDEFLSWTTCGNTLIAMGEDGYYRYASFESDGVKTSGRRVSSDLNGDGSSVRPPASLIQRANQTRRDMTAMAQNIRRAASEQYAVTGEDHFLVMLIDFKDLRFTVDNPNSAFTRLLNEKDYADFYGTGSVRDYYIDQSSEQFKPNFDLFGPYTVSENMSSYSANDGTTQNGAPRLLAEACKIADSDIDFSKYDHDGDGVIDNVFFYYAGYCASSGNTGTIWPHSWSVGQSHYFDGVRLYGYACASEYDGYKGSNLMASIGTFCHEFAHTIGLPDFYDTDYEEQGEGYGLGYYSLMSTGCYNNNEKTPPYFNCEERQLLGWMGETPSLPLKGSCDVTLLPVQNNAGFISPTDNEGEYFYYEYRNGEKWDSPLKSGVIIYHIDKSNNVVEGYTARYRWNNWYGINDVAAHECFKLLFAKQNSVIPFGDSYTDFSSKTTKQALSWAGTDTGYALSDIAHDGKQATFHLTNDNADLFSDMGICAIETVGNWKAGDTFTFKLVDTENNPSSVKWYFDEQVITAGSVVLTAGTHSIVAEITWSNGDSGYYGAMIEVR